MKSDVDTPSYQNVEYIEKNNIPKNQLDPTINDRDMVIEVLALNVFFL